MRKEMVDYIYKHSDKRNSTLKYDFMPDILEIIEKPTHIGGRIIIYGAVLFVIVAFIWAKLAKVDIVVTADAYVIPEGNVCNVNSNVAGTIQTINISDGDYVSEGEVLIELDSESEEEQAEYINEQLAICQAENDVYEKILDGLSVSDINLEGYSNLCQNALNAIIEKQKYYEINIEYMRKYSNDEIYISMTEQENRAEIIQNVVNNEEKISELNQQLAQLEILIKQMSITAPVSGYVSGLNANLVGMRINSAEQLLTIIPDESPLVIQCYVSDADISDIKCGQAVNIKIAAYPYSDYGTLDGEVTEIAAKAEYVENLGNIYMVEVKILDGKNYDLITGMSGSVEIKLGKRSVLEYLFEPVMDKFNNSLKEK